MYYLKRSMLPKCLPVVTKKLPPEQKKTLICWGMWSYLFWSKRVDPQCRPQYYVFTQKWPIISNPLKAVPSRCVATPQTKTLILTTNPPTLRHSFPTLEQNSWLLLAKEWIKLSRQLYHLSLYCFHTGPLFNNINLHLICQESFVISWPRLSTSWRIRVETNDGSVAFHLIQKTPNPWYFLRYHLS